jgi:anti-sigma B factor antagonist
VSIDPENVRTLVVPGPRLDARASRVVLAEAEASFPAAPGVLVLDMSAVDYLDSLGIAALVAIRRRAPGGVRVVLAGLTPYVHTAARLVRLHEVFDVFVDAGAARLSA